MLYRVIPEGDIDLVDGDVVLLTGAAYLRQKMAARFRFFLGEWFLDRREGVPFYRDVFVKNPNPSVIRSVFRQVVFSIKGVVAVPRFELSYEPTTRTLRFDFEAKIDSGETLTISPSDPLFIITVQR